MLGVNEILIGKGNVKKLTLYGLANTNSLEVRGNDSNSKL